MFWAEIDSNFCSYTAEFNCKKNCMQLIGISIPRANFMAFIISRAWSVILAPFAVVKLEQFYEKLQLSNGAKAKILNKQQKYFAIHTSFATNLD